MTENTNDPRTDSMKIEMAEHFAEFEADYRDDVNYEGSEVVFEDDQMVIVADHSGHEINEFASDFDVPRRVLSNWFHKVAKRKTDRSWSTADPIVFDKPETDE
jgi:hypothetical protein